MTDEWRQHGNNFELWLVIGDQKLPVRAAAWHYDTNAQQVIYNPRMMASLVLTPEAYRTWLRVTPEEEQRERTAHVAGISTVSIRACLDRSYFSRLQEAFHRGEEVSFTVRWPPKRFQFGRLCITQLSTKEGATVELWGAITRRARSRRRRTAGTSARVRP